LKKELIVYDPDTWRPYFHTEDFAKVVSEILNLDHKNINKEVFNVGTDKNNHTKRNLVEIIKKYIPNAKIKIQSNGTDRRNYRVNFKKINQLINLKPKTVSEGIEEIISTFNNGKFKDYENNYQKYGNYEISYEYKK